MLIKSTVAEGRKNVKVPACVGITSAPVRVKLTKAPAVDDIIVLDTLEPGVLVADVTVYSGVGKTLAGTIGELNDAQDDLAVSYQTSLSLAAGVNRGAGTGAGLTTANAKQSRTIAIKITGTTALDADVLGKPLLIELGLIRQ